MDAAVRSVLKDASKIALWDESGTVYFSNFQVSQSRNSMQGGSDGEHEAIPFVGAQATPAELKQLTHVFGERDTAIKQGLVAGGVRYEVRGGAVHAAHAPHAGWMQVCDARELVAGFR